MSISPWSAEHGWVEGTTETMDPLLHQWIKVTREIQIRCDFMKFFSLLSFVEILLLCVCRKQWGGGPHFGELRSNQSGELCLPFSLGTYNTFHPAHSHCQFNPSISHLWHPWDLHHLLQSPILTSAPWAFTLEFPYLCPPIPILIKCLTELSLLPKTNQSYWLPHQELAAPSAITGNSKIPLHPLNYHLGSRACTHAICTITSSSLHTNTLMPLSSSCTHSVGTSVTCATTSCQLAPISIAQCPFWPVLLWLSHSWSTHRHPWSSTHLGVLLPWSRMNVYTHSRTTNYYW